MEQQDLELIAAHMGHDEELKSLWEDHVGYERSWSATRERLRFPRLKIWK